MIQVDFYDTISDDRLKFAVIISRYNGTWVFCRHKDRDTLEMPGGHREEMETIEETAVRELKEETGAIDFSIEPVCIYSVTRQSEDGSVSEPSYGKLFFAQIFSFEPELHSEMAQIYLMEEMPERWTYPLIQPHLMDRLTGYFKENHPDML